MGKFDDFFNEFFENNRKNNKDENNNGENLDQDKMDSVERFMNMINNFDENSNKSLSDMLDDELGKPDIIENFEDEGYYFEKRIWFTTGGKIVKIRMIDGPETPEEYHKHLGIETSPETESALEDYLLKSLEDELEIAIQQENFEEAAKLRDLINKKK